MKKLTCLALSSLILLSTGTAAFAQPTGVMPENIKTVYFNQITLAANAAERLQNINSAAVGLTISESGNANVYGDCFTYSKCKINLMAELQQQDGKWKTIKTFYNSAASASHCTLNANYAVESGYSYRVKLTVVADNETVSIYSDTKSY